MNKLFFLFFIFLLSTVPVHATEVIMKVNDVEALAGETVTIELEILSGHAFVGFNADIPLPGGFVYVDGSASLADTDNYLFGLALIDDNVLRMVSLSPTNTAYENQAGAIVRFDVATPLVDGTFELSPENAIVGNADAEDILTGVVSGAITLELVAYTLSFEVVDQDGDPIHHAVIALNGQENEAGDYVFDEVVPGEYDYIVTAGGYVDATGTAAIVDTDVGVSVEMATDDTGIAEIAESDLAIFPNPANTVLNIVAKDTTIEEIRAFDMLGQVIYSANVQGHRHEINVSAFRNGVYFIQVSTAESVQTHRVYISR